MTNSNARIVRGNDFKLRVILKAPGVENEAPTWEDFNINSCSDVHVALICEKDQIVIPLEWEIEAGSTNILICPVKGNYLHSGAAYGVEVKGLDEKGNAWRWKAKGREMFSIVDNTSAQNIDTIAEPEWEINAFVGLLAEIGPQGPTGDKGPQGDKGPTGDKGPQGDQGIQGIQGEKGLTGDKGPTGDQGEKGLTGDKGPDGDKGPTGDKGE